jgi:hypothetical protein
MTAKQSTRAASIDDGDLEGSRQFLKWLGAKNCTFQTYDDNAERKDKRLARIFHGTLDQHAAELMDLNCRGAGVFVALNETDGKDRTRENIKRVRAVSLDLDGSPLEAVVAGTGEEILIKCKPDLRMVIYWERTRNCSAQQPRGAPTRKVRAP